jgi:hypothetical protein
MNIKHHPHFNTMIISKHYSQKDDVPLTYVCTSAPNKNADYAADIFYRDTPHPDYGNRYLGVYRNGENQVMIMNCDTIEDLTFSMIEGTDGWEYSQHRHDYRQVGDYAIDGGRAYPRLISSTSTITVLEIKRMKVKNGVFEEVVDVSST